MQIGELAFACGVSRDTLRHYEKVGVIPTASRGANGYREYDAETIRRVGVVRRAIAIGFTLDELARLFRRRAAGSPPCREVRAMAARKLADLDARIAAMIALREELGSVVARWDDRLANVKEGEEARLIDSLTP